MAILTPTGVLITYGPTLFAAKRSKFDQTKDPRFQGALVFSKAIQATAEYKALAAAVKAAADTLFGAKMQSSNFTNKLKWALKPYDKGAPGDMILSAWSTSAPGVVDKYNNDITVPGDVWSGQLARFDINPKGFDVSGSVGVNCYLNNVQIVKADMPRQDGRTPANQRFSVVEDEAGSVSADEEIPF